MGLVNQTTTSTGEKQTLNFKINEQIDFNAGDTLGQAASAAAATYGIDVNFVDASLTMLEQLFQHLYLALRFKNKQNLV